MLLPGWTGGSESRNVPSVSIQTCDVKTKFPTTYPNPFLSLQNGALHPADTGLLTDAEGNHYISLFTQISFWTFIFPLFPLSCPDQWCNCIGTGSCFEMGEALQICTLLYTNVLL